MTTGPSSSDAHGLGWEDLEHRILDELRAGERRNLGRLVDRYGEELMGYLSAILGRRDVAEDIFQETWVKVIERIDRFRPDWAFAPWLFRIARNGAYDRLRRKQRWRMLSLTPREGEEPARELATPEEQQRQVVARATIEALLEKLEAPQREMLWFRFIHELSYEEIAERCGLPVGTVKSRVSRALHRLATLCEKTEGATHG
jgi:RNA polymerase sigma-70 factor (ECF subfamily)